MSQFDFRNGLLKALPSQSLLLLKGCMQRVSLRRGQVLEEPRLPLQYVYFVESGMVSIQARTRADGLVGAGIIGAAGLVGLPVILESMRSPLRSVVQTTGWAIRVSASDIRRLLAADPVVRRLLLGYVQAVLVQSAYIGLCNARHSVDQRISRWLLLADMALDGQEICVTHQIVATLLGVRRPSVTSSVGELERRGVIHLSRGCIAIRDRELLSESACECHRIIRLEFARVLDQRQMVTAVPPVAPQEAVGAHPWVD